LLFGIKEKFDSFGDLFLVSEGIKLKSLLSNQDMDDFSEPLNLYLRNGKEIVVSYMVQTYKSGEELHYFIHLKDSVGLKISSLKIALTKKEITEFSLSDEFVNFLKDMESSYPFTYLAKSKVQSKMDGFSEMIWIKDNESKFVLANDKFAKHLSLKPSQLEGRPEKNFVPHFVYEFYKSLDKYLKDSLSVASIFSDKVKGVNVSVIHEIIEIPLLDLENNLVAVVGIARPAETNIPIFQKESNNNIIFAEGNNFNLTLESILKQKNKMYEFIISKNPDAVFVYDLESFNFLDVNDAALKLYGYSRQEFLNMDLTDLYLPDEIQTIAESAKNEEGTFVGPFNHRKKDGSLVQVEICKISFVYEEKDAHFNIIRNISDILEKEEQLQMMRTVFEFSQDILIVTDNTGFINYINPAVEAHLGFKRTNLLNNSIVSLANESSRGDFLRKSTSPHKFRATIKKADGSGVETDFTSISFAGLEGEINQVAFIGKTILPEIKAKEVFIEKPVEKIVYVDKPVERVVYVEKKSEGNHQIKPGGIDPSQLSFIFHEILTPINVIVGFISELQDTIEHPSEDQTEAIEIIDENRKKLLYTMDSISEYAQIEQHFGEVKKSTIQLDSLMNKVFKEMSESKSPWKKELVADRINSGITLETDEEKVINLICLVLKIISHVSDEKEIFVSSYQLNEFNFIITFRDHSYKIQQKLLYIIQNLFSESDVSKLRAFGVSRFTIFSAQRLFKLLNGRFEIIQKVGTPFEIGLILEMNAEFKLETPATEEEKGKIFKPAITAEKISVHDSGYERSDAPIPATRRESPATNRYDDEKEDTSSFRRGKEIEKSEYEDFDFDSELEFLHKRRKREVEKSASRDNRKSGEDVPQKKETNREPERRRESFTSEPSSKPKQEERQPDFSRQSYSYRSSENDNSFQHPSKESTPPASDRREPIVPRGDERPRPSSNVDNNIPKKSFVRDTSSISKDEGRAVDLSDMSCLYIEDQLDSQILFKVQMKDLKSVKFAQSFEDAVPLLEENKFDFIVLDINLQGEYNGLDALKIIRTMDGMAKTPIIAVTAYVLPGDKEKFIATGFTDFVSKPIFRNKMVEVLSKIF
jgi:PAS domain S-box-containing protein